METEVLLGAGTTGLEKPELTRSTFILSTELFLLLCP